MLLFYSFFMSIMNLDGTLNLQVNSISKAVNLKMGIQGYKKLYKRYVFNMEVISMFVKVKPTIISECVLCIAYNISKQQYHGEFLDFVSNEVIFSAESTVKWHFILTIKMEMTIKM